MTKTDEILALLSTRPMTSEEIEKGVKYLRSIGWTVIPPKGMK